MNDGRRLQDRVGASVECTWEEFGQLVSPNHELPEPRLRRLAVRVLGPKRGNLVLSELERGRTPRLVPKKSA